jgi:hypothetical protein
MVAHRKQHAYRARPSPSVAFFATSELPMKPNFVNAILFALWPTGRGAGARACTKASDRLPGERNRYLHT